MLVVCWAAGIYSVAWQLLLFLFVQVVADVTMVKFGVFVGAELECFGDDGSRKERLCETIR